MVIQHVKFNYKPMAGWRKTSGFGPRNTGIIGASTMHAGIDGVGKPSDLILVRDGALIQSWWNNYRGWACLFDVGGGYHVLYQHMRYSCQLSLGAKYPAGTVVGVMGNSRSEKVIPVMGVHLHFEVHKDGKPIDPEPYINNLEEYEMITETKIKVNGKVKTVQRILKDGENFVRLRDMEDVLGVVDVEYDTAAKMPIVTD